MTVETPAVLDGRYALDELLGRGGMADVYRSTDQLLLRPVAVKLLRQVSDPVHRDRFVAEARTLASLNHPGLITLLDAGIMGDRPYLVMELATGPTLAARIAEGPVDPDEVTAYGHQLASALGYAHAQGIIHRDVKPSNVLICDDERVLLADFGIARLVDEAQEHTKTGEAIGSPPYLAPEQAAGEGVGPSADVFSLGLVLLEALTAERAYTGTPIEAAVARLYTPPAIPGELDPRWRELIARMTDREPMNRPTAVEVAAELAADSFRAPAVVPDASLEETGALDLTQEGPLGSGFAPGGAEIRDDVRRPRRRRWVALAATLAAAAAVGILVLSPWNQAQSNDPDPVVPAGVPSRMQQPLEDLHRAVEGHHP
jgi:serine/threonine protein kinase